jgi:hypothetical protein
MHRSGWQFTSSSIAELASISPQLCIARRSPNVYITTMQHKTIKTVLDMKNVLQEKDVSLMTNQTRDGSTRSESLLRCSF